MLDEAMALHKDEERICRRLGNIERLCKSRVNQGAIHAQRGNKPEQLHLVTEAQALAREHGLSAVAAQIEAIYNNFKQ